jgi:mannose-6-phosphate isomerase-like protein (cupin superfamily)
MLSLGLSVWPAGLPDEQRPHAEDEVYYVVEGRGRLQVADEGQKDPELG